MVDFDRRFTINCQISHKKKGPVAVSFETFCVWKPFSYKLNQKCHFLQRRKWKIVEKWNFLLFHEFFSSWMWIPVFRMNKLQQSNRQTAYGLSIWQSCQSVAEKNQFGKLLLFAYQCQNRSYITWIISRPFLCHSFWKGWNKYLITTVWAICQNVATT